MGFNLGNRDPWIEIKHLEDAIEKLEKNDIKVTKSVKHALENAEKFKKKAEKAAEKMKEVKRRKFRGKYLKEMKVILHLLNRDLREKKLEEGKLSKEIEEVKESIKR